MRYYPIVFLFSAWSLGLIAQTPFSRVRENLVLSEYQKSHAILDSCLNKNYYKDSVLFYHALVAIKGSDKERGSEYTRQLTKQNPSFGEVHYLKGLLYFLHENYAHSADEFSKAIRANRKDIKAYYNRSLAMGMLEDYLSAIEDLNSCIALDSTYATAYYSRAYWHEYTGNYKEAATDYEHTIRLEPKNFDAYFGLAFAQQILKNATRACETINRAIGQGSQIAEELRERFCHNVLKH